MTTNTDAALEAAAFDEAYAAFVNTMEGTRDRKQAIKAAIDAFLAKALEGADEKLAEIQKRHQDDTFYFSQLRDMPAQWANDDRAELLTLVTALSAEKDRQANGWQAAIRVGKELMIAKNKAESALTAQKAAHAKMLRDEADVYDRMSCTPTCEELRRLADKIEGGSE